MSRLIFILVVIAVIYFLLKSYRSKAPGRDEPPRPQAQDMVSCQYCGIHLPKSESVMANGKYYCCTAHSQGRSE